MIPSLEGLPTKAKEAPSPHEVRLALLDTNPVFQKCWWKTWIRLDLFISSDISICATIAFTPLGNSDHVVISVSIDLPTNLK